MPACFPQEAIQTAAWEQKRRLQGQSVRLASREGKDIFFKKKKENAIRKIRICWVKVHSAISIQPNQETHLSGWLKRRMHT